MKAKPKRKDAKPPRAQKLTMPLDYQARERIRKAASTIITELVWSRTKEGCPYWARVYGRLVDLSQEPE